MLRFILRMLTAAIRSREALILENAALRHQIDVLQRTSSRPHLRWRDRAFWDVLSCTWSDWQKTLYIVRPETVIRWHRQAFRFYWRLKSQPRRIGRPTVPLELRELIREMSRANPSWGAPRIHGELLKLGIEVSQASVSKYMVRPERPSSHTWRTFLVNHAKDIVSVDFFTVPTATFRVLYVFLVLDNARRKIVSFGVTASRNATWTGQQIVEAFPWDTAPRYLIRDRDGKYGAAFDRRVAAPDIHQVLISPHSPWQNPYVERVIGTIRRECLDHVIIFNERHPSRVLREYLGHYQFSRTHLGLEKDCPESREVEPPENGPVVAEPVLGGLHHRYFRQAA